MTGITKIGNEYAQAFGKLYAKTPKAVFAAVAYSYATWACGTEAKTSDEAVARFLSEWRTLQENGIVPQKPPSLAQGAGQRAAAGKDKDVL
jgi:hypothetical protein